MNCGVSSVYQEYREGVSEMQIAELTGVRQFNLVERPLSEPGPGELQVRVSAVGICGSDMHN